MSIHLRPISSQNLRACLGIELLPEQLLFVAPVAKSLSEAYVNHDLVPLAIYPAAARGWEDTDQPVVGFAMYQVTAGVGFILRLMIASEFQGSGLGRLTMLELIRRLRLEPRVEQIATSYQRGNKRMARLCESLGFEPWNIEYASLDGPELFVALPAETESDDIL